MQQNGQQNCWVAHNHILLNKSSLCNRVSEAIPPILRGTKYSILYNTGIHIQATSVAFLEYCNGTLPVFWWVSWFDSFLYVLLYHRTDMSQVVIAYFYFWFLDKQFSKYSDWSRLFVTIFVSLVRDGLRFTLNSQIKTLANTINHSKWFK